MHYINIIVIEGKNSDSPDNATLLREEGGIRIAARTSQVNDTGALCSAHNPDVLLLSVDCLREFKPKWLAGMQQRYADTRILLIGHALPDDALLDCLEIGARGYVKPSAGSLINRALYAVDKGEVWVSRKMSRRVIDHIIDRERGRMGVPCQL